MAAVYPFWYVTSPPGWRDQFIPAEEDTCPGSRSGCRGRSGDARLEKPRLKGNAVQRFALMFRIKPGTEDKVRDLLANYSRPEGVAADGTRLLSTSVFMKDGVVVRMIEIDGDLPGLTAHLSQEPAIQAVEAELDNYLVDEDRRDASTPDGARAFFRQAMMEHVTTRRAGQEPAR